MRPRRLGLGLGLAVPSQIGRALARWRGLGPRAAPARSSGRGPGHEKTKLIPERRCSPRLAARVAWTAGPGGRGPPMAGESPTRTRSQQQPPSRISSRTSSLGALTNDIAGPTRTGAVTRAGPGPVTVMASSTERKTSSPPDNSGPTAGSMVTVAIPLQAQGPKA